VPAEGHLNSCVIVPPRAVSGQLLQDGGRQLSLSHEAAQVKVTKAKLGRVYLPAAAGWLSARSLAMTLACRRLSVFTTRRPSTSILCVSCSSKSVLRFGQHAATWCSCARLRNIGGRAALPLEQLHLEHGPAARQQPHVMNSARRAAAQARCTRIACSPRRANLTSTSLPVDHAGEWEKREQ
jgi:hypothetical protein